ncbi:MAG TPA: hypothetical protein DD426_03035, partial [Clostridiaceae bacterium]|nr:hypothetical protein [Clostridiaceae bacterium]
FRYKICTQLEVSISRLKYKSIYAHMRGMFNIYRLRYSFFVFKGADQMLISLDGRGASWYAGTGIGTYTRQILKNLLTIDGSNNYYIFWSGSEYSPFKRDNAKISLSSKKHHRFWEQYYIPQVLKSKNVDIYHVPQNGMGLPQSKYCLYIATIHDLIPYIMP